TVFTARVVFMAPTPKATPMIAGTAGPAKELLVHSEGAVMSTVATGTTQLRCPACGHIHPPKMGGIILRLPARGHGVFPTRMLGRCAGGGKMKFLIPEPAEGAAAPGAVGPDREVTLQELAAYVSEGTMRIETAEAIAAAGCPETRKRHIAALVAEG